MADFLARQERFPVVGSTNDVVRGWLADGTPEVCLAVADEQRAGRGREGRTWVAPRGAALLLSLGFRPDWLAPDRAWRLAGTVSLAMADAAEEVAGLPDGAIRLKWPNDLAIETVGTAVPHPPIRPTEVRKVAGVLGETEGLGTADPRVVVGIGVDTDWAAGDFPPDLVSTMTSLREASGGRPIDHAALLDAFLGRLEVRIEALRGGRFDVGDWTARQLTTGRDIELVEREGASQVVRAVGVDGAATGGLVIADPDQPTGERTLVVGEVQRVRIAPDAPVEV
ncbi:MAG TPA: biotin--[acetyl-CoA-carboxylase] ligase [Candidatus Saccharimonadales bacterium]|nr:biotin--[acetyl-CoA-carboxylase] ligase [Candidatus Saccharimonadales bacterium]